MFIGISIIIVSLIIIMIIMYNSFIYKENQVNNVFSTVDVLLQKRYDLIPNLVAVVKGYTAHEKEVFEKIAELRTMGVAENISTDEKINIDNQITKYLGSFFALSENYPELKASEVFLNLQCELSDIEDQIAAGRRAYNASVTDLNNAIQMFPTSVIASIFGFNLRTLFQIDNQIATNSQGWYSKHE